MKPPSAPMTSHKVITSVQAYSKLDTSALFCGAPPDIELSPVDQFLANTEAINKIFLSKARAFSVVGDQTPKVEATSNPPMHVAEHTSRGDDLNDAISESPDAIEANEATLQSPQLSPPPEFLPGEVSTLVVLGYMSAVESYFRALVRRLIHLDDHVLRLAEPMTLSFAAAMHHSSALLPEALVEDMSFAGAKSVQAMLRELLGIKGNLPVEVEAVLAEFKKVCEIRHCCVHRFGRLGAKNAQVLGMRDHSKFLENSFYPTFDSLLTIADLLRTFVKTLNNFIFHTIVERVNDDQCKRSGILYEWEWSWDYERDKDRFSAYYTLFASAIDSPASPAVEELYDAFKAGNQALKSAVKNKKSGKAAPAKTVEGSVDEEPANARVAQSN